MLRKLSFTIRRFDKFPVANIGRELHTTGATYTSTGPSIITSGRDPQRARDIHLVQSTKRWIDLVVIGEKLCPFAPPLIESKTIRVVASAAQNASEATNDVKNELEILLRSNIQSKENSYHNSNEVAADACDHSVKCLEAPAHETTLIVFDGDFVRDFHDFVRLSWDLQSDAVVASGFTHDVQLVLFHPTAQHQTYGVDDTEGNAADFTIRSPYPVIHLLREVDVMRAVSGKYPNLEDLPSRNKQKLAAQGLSICKNRLQDCYVPREP